MQYSNAETLPFCTGVIVPGYNRGEALCQTQYTPHRLPIRCPQYTYSQPPVPSLVRIIYTGEMGKSDYRAIVQMSSNGLDWVSTQTIDFGSHALQTSVSWTSIGSLSEPPG